MMPFIFGYRQSFCVAGVVFLQAHDTNDYVLCVCGRLHECRVFVSALLSVCVSVCVYESVAVAVLQEA